MRKKLLFIYNVHAGKELIKNKLAGILDIFAKAGYEITAYPTQRSKDAEEKTREDAGDYDLLVCSGGDGTLDEVVTGMMNRTQRIPIGYIPAGSTNDFANSLGLPKNMLHAARVAVRGESFPCDIGAFNDNFFVYIAAFGIFTDVSYLTPQERKNVLGHMAYVLEGVKRLYSIKSYRIRVTYDDDSKIIEDEFMFGMVTNSRSVGGFKSIIGKHVVLDDGVFEVTLIKKPTNPIELNEILSSLLIKEINTKHMYTFRTGSLHIECREEIPWTLDGEFGGEHTHVFIENHHQAVEIMVKKPEMALG